MVDLDFQGIPSLKLTAEAHENEWLKDEFPFGFRPVFRGKLLVSGSVTLNVVVAENVICIYIYDTSPTCSLVALRSIGIVT